MPDFIEGPSGSLLLCFNLIDIMLRSRHSRQFNLCGTRNCLTNLYL